MNKINTPLSKFAVIGLVCGIAAVMLITFACFLRAGVMPLGANDDAATIVEVEDRDVTIERTLALSSIASRSEACVIEWTARNDGADAWAENATLYVDSGASEITEATMSINVGPGTTQKGVCTFEGIMPDSVVSVWASDGDRALVFCEDLSEAAQYAVASAKGD